MFALLRPGVEDGVELLPDGKIEMLVYKSQSRQNVTALRIRNTLRNQPRTSVEPRDRSE